MAIIDIAAACAALQGGNVVAIPTDTVYGLAADDSQPGAVEWIFELKQRPRDVQVPVLVADIVQARGLALVDVVPYVGPLLDRFWPGALTVVLDRIDGTGTVGLRCPNDPVALELCRAVGPLATTSANLHGSAPLTTAAAVMEQWGDLVGVADGGVRDGAPSTVIDCTRPDGPVLLRQGAIPFDQLWRP
jgi:L-threonylcarbamoyladenylate synthase